jgi:hypothetical protein
MRKPSPPANLSGGVPAFREEAWGVYRLKNTSAQLLGIIDNALDEKTAIERAIEECKVPPSARGRLWRSGGISNSR